jgi:hypothetical protein
MILNIGAVIIVTAELWPILFRKRGGMGTQVAEFYCAMRLIFLHFAWGWVHACERICAFSFKSNVLAAGAHGECDQKSKLHHAGNTAPIFFTTKHPILCKTT